MVVRLWAVGEDLSARAVEQEVDLSPREAELVAEPVAEPAVVWPRSAEEAEVLPRVAAGHRPLVVVRRKRLMLAKLPTRGSYRSLAWWALAGVTRRRLGRWRLCCCSLTAFDPEKKMPPDATLIPSLRQLQDKGNTDILRTYVKLTAAGQLPAQELISLQTRINDTRDFARAGLSLSQRPAGYDVAISLYQNVYALLPADQRSVVLSDGDRFSEPQKLLSELEYAALAVAGIELGLAPPPIPETPRGSAPDRRVFSSDNNVYTVRD